MNLAMKDACRWYELGLADSKSASAGDECNYLPYTAHLAVLSLQTDGQIDQARPLLAAAQFRGVSKDRCKTRRRGFSG